MCFAVEGGICSTAHFEAVATGGGVDERGYSWGGGTMGRIESIVSMETKYAL